MESKRFQVYPPREDTWLLEAFARSAGALRLLEIGTGNGLLALTAARSGARVVATDLNPAALTELRATSLREGLGIECVRTDLAAGLGRFDRILANPPYLPTPSNERDADPGDRLALDGGPDGCRWTARLFAAWPEHLAPDGEAFIVTSTVQDPRSLASILATWRSLGGVAQVVARRVLEGEVLEVLRCVAPSSRSSGPE
ncbi:MAG: HemK2/MTQ2 family protein methyltransferase [Thermoplasmata archaeon]